MLSPALVSTALVGRYHPTTLCGLFASKQPDGAVLASLSFTPICPRDPAGWQLLAKQVDREHDGDSAADSSDGDDADAEADNSRQRLHTRTHSNGSNLSEESGLGGSTSACVTPRPHQWLYKEYKILDEIGSGGFGRVCRCVHHT
jgi:hypothetical protein